DNDIALAQSITLDSGIISTNSPPAVGFGDNSVSGGVYNNATDGDGNFGSPTVTWDFPELISAFGADFIGLDDGQLTLTGNFDGTGDQTLTVFTEIGGSDGFLGIVGMANFSSIVFGNNTNSVDAFDIDNASFATPAESVPEPSSILALGMLGSSLLLTKRGKKN
ncbi:MAG: PEP-CTERM sorting domain-containing protein, partial [Crocosphaera sp.]